jgi:hypothetical protein
MSLLKYLRDQYEFCTERAREVMPKGGKLVCGKGRDTLLHRESIAETLQMAEKDCPQAADTIRVLLWQQSFYAMQALNVAKFEKGSQE